ncbi:uncharacterized protein LOC126899567 [Daktulosphaira vitifoliae]|uniref:uncharacterized protein LOC126899567 n=1 Tax=Daktulosphaira vitifoliae TaxID=58002 RepID=UPI0021AACC4B|nr:uncharacterized protein LOC126899567 [Daktulosphaira vitifoliae]
MNFQSTFLTLYSIFLHPEKCVDSEFKKISWINEFHDEISYNKKLINLLNEVETWKVKNQNNSDTFYFDEKETKLLTNRCKEDLNCLKDKSKAIVKYKQKLESVQCINAAFSMLILPDLFIALLWKVPVKNISKDAFHFYRQSIARMISLMYMSYVPTHNWLWSIYSILLDIEYQQKSKMPINVDQFMIMKLKDDLSQHLNLCITYKYLTEVDKPRATEKIRYEENIKKLCYALYNNKDKYSYLNSVYSFSKKLEFKYLAILNIIKLGRMMFDFVPLLSLNWENTKLLMGIEEIKNNLNRYFYIIIQIVNTNVLYLIWKHLAVLEVSLSHILTDTFGNEEVKDNFEFYRNTLEKSLELVVQQLDIKDSVIISILQGLKFRISGDNLCNKVVNNLKLLLDQIKTVISEDLLILNINSNEIKELFSTTKLTPDIHYNTTIDEFKHYTNQIENFANSIDQILQPANFNFIRFFFDGKLNLTKTFFMIT